MAGTRGGIGRIAAMAAGLAIVVLLALAGEARAAKYSVAQCGWYVGIDADWADTTAGAKFRPDAYCVPGPPADPFDGSHLKTFGREGQGTVSGTRFGRWRWTAPAGTTITQFRGTWWHALHDGFEQRIGTVNWAGFVPFATAAATDVTPREFVIGFGAAVWAIEDRLLCAKGEDKWCALDPGSWAALRAVTLTLDDQSPPAAAIGGDLYAGGWRRGVQGVAVSGGDLGSGVRYGETRLDGARIALTEYPCAIASIGGEWRGTRMVPCPLSVSGSEVVDTARFSDGPHAVCRCVYDFAGTPACTPNQQVLIDNNPPAHPRSPTLAGGEGWRRTNDFDLSWGNPDQAPASPIAGASWQLTGPGFDSGVHFVAGRGLTELANLAVPEPGAYSLALWLRDEAGNEAPSAALSVPLRFDDVPPRALFEGAAGEGLGDQVRAVVEDAHSGPASGSILYRREDSNRWLELPTKLSATASPGTASLTAPAPDLAPGTYLFRADVADAAGNTASGTRRRDGTEMVVRQSGPTPEQRAKARLFARLRRGGHADPGALTVPYGATALVTGRLTGADGAGLSGRPLRVVTRPSRGSLADAAAETVRTGARGGFSLRLAPGPSRRVTVGFAGERGFRPAARSGLELRVRSGVSLRVEPRSLRTGQALRLSGEVEDRGAPIPRRGKLVAIQYLEQATHRWRPVLVARSDHDGRFHARYRFRYVSGKAEIRLRATALAEERWPYAPGSSGPITVTVVDR
jgi:hypothetical protein